MPWKGEGTWDPWIARNDHHWTTRNTIGKGKALRNAAPAVRREKGHDHPFYWAPFVLLGDWMR